MGASLAVAVRLSRPGFELDVSFEAPPGITILFGPSGSGKSSTLALVAGLLRPTSGSVRLGDEVLFDARTGVDTPVHARRLGFVFQSLALFPHLDAVANVRYGMPRPRDEDARDRALAMLDRLHVKHLADRKPGTFSGGEAQRVALARTFAMEPRALLLDEPFSALDRELRRELAREVRAYADAARLPTLFVTHHRREARSVGDRIVLLRDGRVVAAGDTQIELPDDD